MPEGEVKTTNEAVNVAAGGEKKKPWYAIKDWKDINVSLGLVAAIAASSFFAFQWLEERYLHKKEKAVLMNRIEDMRDDIALKDRRIELSQKEVTYRALLEQSKRNPNLKFAVEEARRQVDEVKSSIATIEDRTAKRKAN